MMAVMKSNKLLFFLRYSLHVVEGIGAKKTFIVGIVELFDHPITPRPFKRNKHRATPWLKANRTTDPKLRQ